METITVEIYRDAYGERVGLKYRYNPDTNQTLKDNLPFPKFKWDSEKRLWSLQNYANVVAEACDILDGLGGYDTSVVRTYASASWTKVKRTRLYLHWPYLSDNYLRDTVLNAVRSISGRKFHSEEKCWSIPVEQAITLHGLLKDSYQPLASKSAVHLN
jgi:hypothetical protein